jgi:hypothetical protein
MWGLSHLCPVPWGTGGTRGGDKMHRTTERRADLQPREHGMATCGAGRRVLTLFTMSQMEPRGAVVLAALILILGLI